MAIYTFEIFRMSGTYSGTVLASVTITVSDEDDLGIGDRNATDIGTPSTETGLYPIITAVSDPAYNGMIGQRIDFSEQGQFSGGNMPAGGGFDYFAIGFNSHAGASPTGGRWVAQHPNASADILIGQTYTRSGGISVLEAQGQPVCFTAGTLIKTRSGDVAVEDLRAGDMVLTFDAGYQEIRWVGGRKVSAAELRVNDKLKPIRVCADALGPGVPKYDLLVSPQHRILLRSPIAARMFGSAEVLIPANKLLELPGVYVDSGEDGVEYFHLLFDAHQLVWSNGAVTESLFTGPEARKAVSAEAREEIAALFPQILEPDFTPVSVRPIPRKVKRIRNLVQRITKHGRHVQTPAREFPSHC